MPRRWNMSSKVRSPLTLALLATALAGGVVACVPQVSKISGRNPDLFEKETDHLAGRSRGVGEDAPPEMFVKQKQMVIKDTSPSNETGSLFNPDDERNYFFTPNGPLSVGRFLKIKVVANRMDDKDKGGPEKKKDEAKKDEKTAKAGKDGKGAKDDGTEDELLKALPDLAPAKKGEPSLLKSFKMQIVHKYENGDVLAMMTRKTGDGDQAGEVSVQARIPYDRLSSGDELTTDDLLDVKLHENRDGDVADRSSSDWQDEYSLRLSGFREAKSKEALALAGEKQQLEDADKKLETRIKSFGDERKQLAKQRDDLAKKSADQDDKVQKLQDQVKEQQDKIQKQDDQIKSLTPENKPSDGKEAANG